MGSSIEALTERVYEKHPEDNDIWLLLQEVISLKHKVQKHEEILSKLEVAINPMLCGRKFEIHFSENEH